MRSQALELLELAEVDVQRNGRLSLSSLQDMQQLLQQHPADALEALLDAMAPQEVLRRGVRPAARVLVDVPRAYVLGRSSFSDDGVLDLDARLDDDGDGSRRFTVGMWLASSSGSYRSAADGGELLLGVPPLRRDTCVRGELGEVLIAEYEAVLAAFEDAQTRVLGARVTPRRGHVADAMEDWEVDDAVIEDARGNGQAAAIGVGEAPPEHGVASMAAISAPAAATLPWKGRVIPPKRATAAGGERRFSSGRGPRADDDDDGDNSRRALPSSDADELPVDVLPEQPVGSHSRMQLAQGRVPSRLWPASAASRASVRLAHGGGGSASEGSEDSDGHVHAARHGGRGGHVTDASGGSESDGAGDGGSESRRGVRAQRGASSSFDAAVAARQVGTASQLTSAETEEACRATSPLRRRMEGGTPRLAITDAHRASLVPFLGHLLRLAAAEETGGPPTVTRAVAWTRLQVLAASLGPHDPAAGDLVASDAHSKTAALGVLERVLLPALGAADGGAASDIVLLQNLLQRLYERVM